jgi:hypothetical protein
MALCREGGLPLGGIRGPAVNTSTPSPVKSIKQSRDDKTKLGPFARDSVKATRKDRNFTQEIRDKINDLFAKFGCHSCGTKVAGIKSGNAVPDHVPPGSTSPGPYDLHPHCLNSSRIQGGQLRSKQYNGQ